METGTLKWGPSAREHLAISTPDSRSVGTDAYLIVISVGASQGIEVTYEQEGLSANTQRTSRSKPGVE